MYDNGKRKDLGKNSSELKVTKTENRYEYYYVDIVSNDGSKKSKTFSLYGKEESNFSFLAYVNGEYKSFGDGDYAVHCTIESEKKIELYVDAKEISGKDITYQWEKESSETGTEIIVGATEATYIAPQLESDTDTYTCIVSCDGDSQGCTFYLNKKTTAQKARLGNRNFRTSFSSFGALLSVLFIRAIQKSGRLYDAMESRCYDGTIRVLHQQYPVKRKELFLCIGYELLLLYFSWKGLP